MTFKLLDLFSGIGGFSLGLERSGEFKTVAFCEIEPYCRRVLARHWPDVPCYDDIRTLTADTLQRDGIAVDAICGGFPCQDLSHAGKRAGLEGARSGLWSEYARLIGELRPRVVIVENVPGLLSLGMGTVLGDLSALGYDAVWDCVPASAVGAPHRRDRVWIVAHPTNRRRSCVSNRNSKSIDACSPGHAMADANRGQRDHAELAICAGRNAADDGRANLAHTHPTHLEGGGASDDPTGRQEPDGYAGLGSRTSIGWETEPNVGRVAHGVPSRVDRLKALGNAVVPQIPELIGRAIMEAMQ